MEFYGVCMSLAHRRLLPGIAWGSFQQFLKHTISWQDLHLSLLPHKAAFAEINRRDILNAAVSSQTKDQIYILDE